MLFKCGIFTYLNYIIKLRGSSASKIMWGVYMCLPRPKKKKKCGCKYSSAKVDIEFKDMVLAWNNEFNSK